LSQSCNTFFVIFHKFDEEFTRHSEDTLRYKMGNFLYFVFFFAQSFILVATYIAAWFIYIRLALFLKPEKSNPSSPQGEMLSDDE